MSKAALSLGVRLQLAYFLESAAFYRRHARVAAEQGLSVVTFYREEYRRYLRQARALVNADQSFLEGRLVAKCWSDRPLEVVRFNEEKRNAPVQVSVTPAFRRLSLLCVLVQAGKGRTTRQPVHCLPRLRAPWAPVSGQWPLVLPAPLRLRAVQAQAPTLAQLDRCVRYGQADSVCANPRALRTGVEPRLGGRHVRHA